IDSDVTGIPDTVGNLIPGPPPVLANINTGAGGGKFIRLYHIVLVNILLMREGIHFRTRFESASSRNETISRIPENSGCCAYQNRLTAFSRAGSIINPIGWQPTLVDTRKGQPFVFT